MQSTMESCAGKTVMAGVMGGGLGAMFGLFMSSVGYISSLIPSSTTDDRQMQIHTHDNTYIQSGINRY